MKKKNALTGKRLKSILTISLAVVTVFSMTGCSGCKKNTGSDTGISGTGKEEVFRAAAEFKPGFDINSVTTNGEKICLFNTVSTDMSMGSDPGSNSFSSLKWCISDLSGNCGAVNEYKEDATASYECFVPRASYLDSDDSLYIAYSKYNYEDETQEGWIYKFSPDGKLVSNKQINEKNINGLIKMPDGTFVAADGDVSTLHLFDSDFNEKGTIPTSGEMGGKSLILTDDGKLYLAGRNFQTNKSEFIPVDVSSKTIGDAITPDFPQTVGTVGMQNILNGKGYDCYFSDSEGISGITIASSEMKKLLNYIDSDIDISQASPDICVVDSEHVVLTVSDATDESLKGCTLYVKVDPKDVADKEIITLGGLYFGWGEGNVKSIVNEFNKKNSKYRIRVLDYSQYNVLADDGSYTDEGAKTALRNDLTTGKAPDILITTNMDDVDNYMQKGVFTDLTPLLEKAGYNKSDYLENIVAAGSIGDQYYVMMPQFSVECYMTKAEYVDSNGCLSLDRYMDIEKKQGNVGKSMSYCSKEKILRQAIKFNSQNYMDVSGNTCSFDSPEFKKVLALANEFPGEDTDDFNRAYEDTDYTILQGDRNIMCEYSMASFRALCRASQYNYGDQKVVLCGFPDEEGDGTGVISPRVGITISSTCRNKEGAFEFLQYFLSDDYQNVIDNGSWISGFPFEKKAFEAMAETSKEPYKEKNNGVWEEQEDTYYYNGNKKYYKPITDEMIGDIKKFVLASDTISESRTGIMNLILEEAAPYFAGQKTADEITGIIQSRVSIYIRERN